MTGAVRGRVRRRMPVAEREPEPEHRPSRRRYVRRRWIAVAVLAAVTGLTYAVLFTSLFGVHSVDVSGTRTIPADTVRAAAAIEPGTPLARLDTDEVRDRVAALPKVFSVEVSRSFPSTVEIVVVERGPVAVVSAGDGVHLVDATGLDYEVAKANPGSLPELAVSTVRPDDPATRAAVTVLGVIPQQLRAQVVKVSARTAGSVELALADGRTVRWGGADESERKAAVLAPLLTRPGTVYDVTTPDFPTVS
ncbi:MAG TPA: FtsQ-type POTRA domain-containing protein [Actinophytocola sp.]|uniref:cell division protein FtsQ/DivIB n=1 Tax=Actinophytocola sp. TaxID=1872138 RepID=UPI002DDD7BE9|nr:FtsQ-type POTRA domain-containing protein [Actinophytocola sp.]HEV2781982.1 FtsQ-type POTRA domain-containing protein [Actinophytocola sp.]